MDNQAVMTVIKCLIRDYKSEINNCNGAKKGRAEVIVDALVILKEYWYKKVLHNPTSVADIDVEEVRVILELTTKDIRLALRKSLTAAKRTKYMTILHAIKFVLDNYSFLLLRDVWKDLEAIIKAREKLDPRITHFNIYLRTGKGSVEIVDHIVLNPEMP